MSIQLSVRIRTLFAGALLAGVAALVGPAQAQGVPDRAKVNSPGGWSALNQILSKEGKVKVIVTLNLNNPFRAAGYLPPGLARAQRDDIADRQAQVLRAVGPNGVANVVQFQEVPQLAMTVNANALDRLTASPLVQAVAEDDLNSPGLDLSVPRIGAPTLWSQGITGSGKAVAILDTGVEKTHAFLTGAVVSEACYSNANTAGTISGSGYTSVSICPGGVVSSTAVNSAMPYGGACPAGKCDHGTHVAGIVAGRNNGSFSGVAPAASLIAVQVFSRFDDTGSGACGGAGLSCALAYSSDIIKGLERVAALKDTYSIASANMSLGGGKYLANCDSDTRKPIIDTLRSYGIATVISSGNSGYTDAMGAPGCISTAVSVGATTDSDTVASYSNSVSFLNLLAPGSSINSSVPGGLYANYNGTSMAAPHVAGAFALIRQARPNANVTDIVSALIGTGVSITDSKNGLTKPRIQVNLATSALPFAGSARTLGLFSAGIWYLDANGNHVWNGTPNDMQSWFGTSNDIPVVGDWSGNGITKIGVFRSGVWYLDYNGNGVWDGPAIDRVYSFGAATDVPVVGAWTAGGPTKIGVFRNGEWYLDYNGNGVWEGVATDRFYSFGKSGDVPVTGDWNGNGVSKLGLFRNGEWYLDYNGNGVWNGAPTDVRYVFGVTGDVPVVGDWNGSGIDKIGVYRAGAWYLDYSGTGSWNGTIADQLFGFGGSGHKPLVGKAWK